MLKLTGLTLEGFKSFAAPFSAERLPGLPGAGRMTNRLALGDVTVLVGPNGAGKSNIVSFFRMLSAMIEGRFQEFVARSGGADSILNYGVKKTPEMNTLLEFDSPPFELKYECHLISTENERLIFTNEVATCHRRGSSDSCGALNERGDTPTAQRVGYESILYPVEGSGKEDYRVIAGTLETYRNYHFHDTSAEAGIRRNGYVEDAYFLRRDARNLAAFLFGMKNRAKTEAYYRRIENTVQLAFPQFGRFVLKPQVENERQILLNWYSRGDEDYLFGPHQFSDGALRFAALTALFLQPPDDLPTLIVLDEPELGLHPQAIELLAGMIKGVAQQQTQVLVATQSTQLVNHFNLGQIRPIEHRGGRSVILDLDPDAYTEWLEEYSTGELWEKNIIGGGPTHG